MKVYLAGPMSGIPHFNFPAFHAAAKQLRSEGHIVFCPAEADMKRYGIDISADNPTGDPLYAKKKYGVDIRECLGEDCEWICRHAEGIALLPSWEKSSGARAEWALACALGLEFIYLGVSDVA